MRPKAKKKIYRGQKKRMQRQIVDESPAPAPAPIPEQPKRNCGLDLIIEERMRHVGRGFTAKHDDLHTGAELELAARCYAYAAKCMRLGAQPAAARRYLLENDDAPRWPWSLFDLHVDTALHCYVKAGALFLAEACRLERAGFATGRLLGHVQSMAVRIRWLPV